MESNYMEVGAERAMALTCVKMLLSASRKHPIGTLKLRSLSRPPPPGEDLITSWLERVLDVGNSMALKDVSPVHRAGACLPGKQVVNNFSFILLLRPLPPSFPPGANLPGNPGAGGEKERDCGNCHHDSKNNLGAGK